MGGELPVKGRVSLLRVIEKQGGGGLDGVAQSEREYMLANLFIERFRIMRILRVSHFEHTPNFTNVT